jgi:hypothetical protein
MSIFPWDNHPHPLACLFFHVLYDNEMTFDSDLRSVRSTALEHVVAAGNRTSTVGWTVSAN